MQSPMQFRAIQVRLVLCTSDTVTVYPSPTHTRTNASRKTPSSRVARTRALMHTGGVGGAVQLWMQPSVLYVPCRSYERSRMRGRGGDLRLRHPQESDRSSRDPRRKLCGRRPEHGASSPGSGVFAACESRPSGDKTAHNSAPEGYRGLCGFWQNLLLVALV